MAGRPTKYTPEVVNIIRESLAQGDSRQLACKKAGISDDSFGRWLADNAEFAAVVKNAEDEFRNWEHAQLLASAKKGLRVLIEGQETEETTTEYELDADGNPRIKRQTTKVKKIPPSATAIIFALVNRDPENWKNRINSEVEAKVQSDQRADVNLKNIPDDLLESVVKAINGEV